MKRWFEQKSNIKLYNFIFPFWLMLVLPPTCIVALIGNFIIDSIVLLVGMKAFKINNKKHFYKKKIINVFGFGWGSDIVGVAFLLIVIFFEISNTGEELYVTIPAVIISAIMIFLLNYFKTFKNSNTKNSVKDRVEEISPKQRFWLSFILSVTTAPYTFMIPLYWFLDLIQK